MCFFTFNLQANRFDSLKIKYVEFKYEWAVWQQQLASDDIMW